MNLVLRMRLLLSKKADSEFACVNADGEEFLAAVKSPGIESDNQFAVCCQSVASGRAVVGVQLHCAPGDTGVVVVAAMSGAVATSDATAWRRWW